MPGLIERIITLYLLNTHPRLKTLNDIPFPYFRTRYRNETITALTHPQVDAKKDTKSTIRRATKYPTICLSSSVPPPPSLSPSTLKK